MYFQVTVVLAGFSRHRLTDALDFVKKNADYSLEKTDDGCQRKLRITGVFYSQTFATTVEKELNLRSDQCSKLGERGGIAFPSTYFQSV